MAQKVWLLQKLADGTIEEVGFGICDITYQNPEIDEMLRKAEKEHPLPEGAKWGLGWECDLNED